MRSLSKIPAPDMLTRTAWQYWGERLEQMGKIHEAAKMAAPTRSHPSTPNTPVASMLADSHGS
jgi:hypothetical protein